MAIPKMFILGKNKHHIMKCRIKGDMPLCIASGAFITTIDHTMTQLVHSRLHMDGRNQETVSTRMMMYVSLKSMPCKTVC